MGKSKKHSVNSNPTLLSILFTSAVVAAIISGIFSLIVANNTNKRLSLIEQQKFDYEILYGRFAKLQEYMDYFAGFQVYEPEFINDYSINDESSLSNLRTVFDEASSSFLSKSLQLIPYLSDNACEKLECLINENALLPDPPMINLEGLETDDDINVAIKEHMRLVNNDFRAASVAILQLITLDLYSDFLSNTASS